MEWFRMYSEFANDPKVQSMSEAMQRRLMMLLCLRCSNTLVTLQEDEIAFSMRISDADLAETKAIFVRKGFINEAWEIQNWDKRQFVSDSSASRVARHRAKAKTEAETPAVTPCNVTVTPQIQNRTEVKDIVASDAADDLPASPSAPKPSAALRESASILDYLNEKTGHSYKPVDANLKLIAACLKSSSAEECRAVIDNRVTAWGTDPKMADYLRPGTLFNASKFAQYVGQLGRSTGSTGRDYL